jgi:hypothetical protein
LAYDRGDLDSVHAAAGRISAGPTIDVLINNAGVMQFTHSRTKQGFEQHFGVNHLGTFAFTSLLLQKLADAPAPRVVVTGSASHKTGVIDFDDLNAEKGYRHSPRYNNSKLANMPESRLQCVTHDPKVMIETEDRTGLDLVGDRGADAVRIGKPEIGKSLHDLKGALAQVGVAFLNTQRPHSDRFIENATKRHGRRQTGVVSQSEPRSRSGSRKAGLYTQNTMKIGG